MNRMGFSSSNALILSSVVCATRSAASSGLRYVDKPGRYVCTDGRCLRPEAAPIRDALVCPSTALEQTTQPRKANQLTTIVQSELNFRLVGPIERVTTTQMCAATQDFAEEDDRSEVTYFSVPSDARPDLQHSQNVVAAILLQRRVTRCL